MNITDIPEKFPIPFASAAGGSYIRPIPEASQIGIEGGAASLTDGFPPLNFQPRGAGGVPPFGEDFNGLLNQITAWTQWQNAGAAVPFDAAFSAAVGGYPAGAVVASTLVAGLFWRSTTDDNVTNPDTGGAGWVQQGRIKLSAATTFNVATTGSDAPGVGLGTSGAPWATPQHAADALAAMYDLNGFQATVQLADGTYTAGALNAYYVGGTRNQSVVFTGNAVTPDNVKIISSSTCFTASGGTSIGVTNMQLKCTGAGNTCLGANTGGNIAHSGLIFDTAPLAHIIVNSAGYVSSGGTPYKIIGGAQYHMLSTLGAVVGCEGSTVTLTGTPAFSNAFAGASSGGQISARTATFTGAATGSRYSAVSTGVIDTNGGGANFFPGSVAGSVDAPSYGVYL